MRTLRIMSAEDVETPHDLLQFHRLGSRALVRLTFEYMLVAATTRAMLRRADRLAKENRRGKVARPTAFASSSAAAAAKLSRTSTVRLRNLYPELFGGSRRTSTRRNVA